MTTSTAVVNFKSLVSRATVARSASADGESSKTTEDRNGRTGITSVRAENGSGSESRPPAKLTSSTNNRASSNGSAGKDPKVQSTASRAAEGPAEMCGADSKADSLPTGVDPLDLFHSVASLYDRCLPGTDTDDIYDSMAASSTRTILVYMDTETAISECQKAYARAGDAGNEDKTEKPPSTSVCADGAEGSAEDGDDEDDDEEASVLADVFSDTDSEDDSSDEEDDDEDDTSLDLEEGQSDFLARVKLRRKLRKAGQWDSESVGVESRLAGALTFRWVVQDDVQHPLAQITLLSVRPRFRKRGLGKHLLQQVKDHSISGQYTALISYVDSSAVDFFRRNGFEDDAILCNKYIDAVDPWYGSTFMCHIPYHHQLGDDLEHSSTAASLNFLSQMDVGMASWKKVQTSSYQQQVIRFEQMKRHILALQASVSLQQDKVDLLTGQVRSLEREKRAAVHELDMYKKLNRLELTENGKSTAEETIARLESEVEQAAAGRNPKPLST